MTDVESLAQELRTAYRGDVSCRWDELPAWVQETWLRVARRAVELIAPRKDKVPCQNEV